MRKGLAALVVSVLSWPVLAQVPGRNVNMVSGTKWPDGDPYLQRQNEPSVAASTRNPLHLAAGANDYRTVDIPGLPNGDETGDAWLGLFKSTDGGQRWTSSLIPGYPQDASPEGLGSPVKGFAAAADPVVRAGTSGLIYYSGLAFNRGTDAGSAIFVARLIDNDNREASDPFQYIGTSLVATSPAGSGRFFDKPWLAVDIPRFGSGTCSIVTTVKGQPQTQRVPAGTAYMAFSSITGADATLRSQILFTSSRDCGATWSSPVALSPPNEIAQGATIAIDPLTGAVYVAWRRFSVPDGKDVDGIMVSRSLLAGIDFLPPGLVRKLARSVSRDFDIDDVFEHHGAPEQHGFKGKPKEKEVAPVAEFDQSTSADVLRFRSNAYPSMTFDDRGRAYIVWTERGFSTVPSQIDPVNGDAKIVISSAGYVGGWSNPQAIDPASPGHQLMPSIAYAGGKLLVAFYDLRDDVSQTFSKYVQDLPTPIGPDGGPKRHTMDIRGALGVPGVPPAFASSVKISQYLLGTPAHEGGAVQQLQANPPNLPMFGLGTVPFMGDYIDVAPAPAFVRNADGRWQYNTSSSSVPVFHAVWTDNRDVRAPLGGDWTRYTPPTVQDGVSGRFDPSMPRPVCSPGFSASRNQNIYTSRISGGLIAGAPSNAKPLSTSFERGFVVFAQNATNVTRVFRLRIMNQPAGGRASFQQWFPSQTPLPPPVLTLDVTTLPYSTAVRTLYATSSDPHAPIVVDVSEIAAVGAPTTLQGGLQSTIGLNPDPATPDIENPDIENTANPDIENAEVMTPDIENLAVKNPDVENVSVKTPDIENPDIENITIANPDIENPDIENTNYLNPDIENPDIENPDIENQSLTDITWNVTNTGNTTSAYNVNLFLNQAQLPNGLKVQLVLYKTYKTPVSDGCTLETESRNVLVANIPNPQFVTPDSGGLPDPNRPDGGNGTLWLAPGETGRITLRVVDPDSTNNIILPNGASIDPGLFDGGTPTVTPAIVPQPVDTVTVAAGGTKPDVVTTDQSTIFFLSQPSTVPAGEVMPPVRVQVRDKSGAVVPGAMVALTLAVNPGGAVLVGVATSVSDAAGTATFANVQVNQIGSGYQLQASVSVPGITLTPVLSSPFAVLPLIVTNTSDAGPGSLRQAMTDANSHPGLDTITFSIPGPGPYSIAPHTVLPQITDPVVIDAMSQPGAVSGTPAVEIDGEFAPAPAPLRPVAIGFDVVAGGSTIRGFVINRFGGQGIRLEGSGSTILGNYIGTDRSGTAARGNAGPGVLIAGSSSNIIGTTSASDRNVISGNASGVQVLGPAAGNAIVNNRIGTTADGMAGLPNVNDGIGIDGGPGGGVTAQTLVNQNLIAGNGNVGIDVVPNGGSTRQTQILGNTIGLDAGGRRLGNARGGISLVSAALASIGGAGMGNVISANGGAGITITGAAAPGTATVVQGNYVGTDPTGTLPRGNVAGGIVVQSPNVLIGWHAGDPAGSGNVISGNGADGIQLLGAGVTDVAISGNMIGTDVTGTAAVGSDLDDSPFSNFQGIYIQGGSLNVIGGSLVQQRNVISGNRINGIFVDTGSANNTISGNYIGTDATGFKPIPNGWDGVGLLGASANTVTTNLISGNAQRGIFISGSANHIVGNSIGTTVAGAPSLGNMGAGIEFAARTPPGGLTETPADNVIGETLANAIAGNGGGVIVAAGTGNRVLSNSIYANAGLGIDLGGDGPTPNDAGDGDPGPNNQQNFPVLSGASTNAAAGRTYVSYSLDTASGTYRLQFFASATCGAGVGQTLLLDTTITANGVFTDTIDVPAVPPGSGVSVTATDAAGNTSEFSNCITPAATNAFLWSRSTGGNGHLYEYVTSPGTWQAAQSAAAGRSVNGYTGHLATITSGGENTFVANLRVAMGLGDMRGWIGLYDTCGNACWTWVTGEGFAFSSWAGGEPNNIGAELAVEFFATGEWNNIIDSGNGFNQGYVVEYEGS
jgi:parallel beta-helix repeat protein